MPFITVPINITGPSYKSRSKPLSSQQTKNWYHQLDQKGKVEYVLMPFPGLKAIGNETGVDRGFHRMAEILYQVKGTSLYEIDKFGNHTLRGVIPGIDRTIIKDDGINMFIVSDLKVWQYSTDTNTVIEVTDPEITGAKSVDFINNQFLYTKDRFTTVSDVGNGASASGLNIVGEETLPDDLVRDFVYDEVIYRCGVRSIVGWYNSGIGSPPIEKLQGRIFDVGLSAIHSIAKTDEAFYWLGDDNAIYRAEAGRKERISDDAISNELSTYSNTSDAIGNVMTFEGQNFYCITFPTDNRTFILSEKLGINGWFEISSGIEDGRYQGSSFISAYNKTFVADETNGNVYELDLNTYMNNGEILQRTRVTQTVDAKLIGGSGRDRVQMSVMNIEMETGVGLISGQGENPRIMIETSDDGGRTWESGEWAETGRLGEFTLLVEFFNLDSFYSRMFRLSTTDPVNYTIYSASIDLRLAGM